MKRTTPRYRALTSMIHDGRWSVIDRHANVTVHPNMAEADAKALAARLNGPA